MSTWRAIRYSMFEATKEVSSFLFVAVAHVPRPRFLAKFEIVRRHFSILCRAYLCVLTSTSVVKFCMLMTETFFIINKILN